MTQTAELWSCNPAATLRCPETACRSTISIPVSGTPLAGLVWMRVCAMYGLTPPTTGNMTWTTSKIFRDSSQDTIRRLRKYLMKVLKWYKGYDKVTKRRSYTQNIMENHVVLITAVPLPAPPFHPWVLKFNVVFLDFSSRVFMAHCVAAGGTYFH